MLLIHSSTRLFLGPQDAFKTCPGRLSLAHIPPSFYTVVNKTPIETDFPMAGGEATVEPPL